MWKSSERYAEQSKGGCINPCTDNEAFYANLHGSKVKLYRVKGGIRLYAKIVIYVFIRLPFNIPDILIDKLCNGAVNRVTVTF